VSAMKSAARQASHRRIRCLKKFRSRARGTTGLGLREESKRDSSAAQADSFADERGEKASACSGRNDRFVGVG